MLPGHCCSIKSNRTDARAKEVLDEIYDLFIDLDARKTSSDSRRLHNARDGVAIAKSATIPRISSLSSRPSSNPSPRLPEIRRHPANPGNESRLQRFSRPHRIGRVFSGTISAGTEVGISKSWQARNQRASPSSTRFAVSSAMKLKAFCGDLVAIAGVEGIQIGESTH